MGNQNGTLGNDYYNRSRREHAVSRYADANLEEDDYSDLKKFEKPWPEVSSFKPTAAGILRSGLDPTSISVLGRKTADLREHFILGRKLGQGQFGTTYLCTEISTGCEYACKTILKRKLITKEDVEDVRREIQIMHHLSGHKNVVSIKDVYEDGLAVHIVMELLAGGELFDRIQGKGHYAEPEAAELIRIVVSIVAMCHSLGVIHRDLKPENFLLLDKDDDLSIKAIDFGLSAFFKPGEVFSELVGSPYYIAPEVLYKRYGPESDVWSAGVILYVLLSGVPPFWAETQQGIFDAVLKGNIDFESEPWPKISDSAKDLLKKMLCHCPSERLKAHEVLRHPWICENGMAGDHALDPSVISRLKHFSGMNNLKKLALRVIAERLSEEEIAGLREMFKAVDIKNRGVITFGELRKCLTGYGAEEQQRERGKRSDTARPGPNESFLPPPPRDRSSTCPSVLHPPPRELRGDLPSPNPPPPLPIPPPPPNRAPRGPIPRIRLLPERSIENNSAQGSPENTEAVHMLAGSMNNGGGNVIDISDSDDDFDFDFDSDDPASANATPGRNGEGQSVRSQDEERTPSSSSGIIKNNNGQYRHLPSSFASAIDAEKARYTLGSGDRTYPHSNSNVGPRRDSVMATLSSSRLDSAGLAADSKDNGKRILPFYSNESTSKPAHPSVASQSRIPPSRSTNGNTPRLGDNKMGTNVANGIGQPSSSRFPIQSSSVSNTQKAITDDDDDDVFVYDGPSSHRVLPSSLGGHNSANNTELANINDMQARPNLENRIMDPDERAVYQEALQHISRDKKEDDLPEGVLSVSLLKHQKMALAWMVSKENSSHCAGGILADDQGLGKTVSTIALILKQRIQQSKFMDADSDPLKSEALNLDEDDEAVTVADKVEQSMHDEPKKDIDAGLSSTAASTSDVKPSISHMDTVPDTVVERKVERKKTKTGTSSASSTMRSMTRPAAGTLVVCPASVLKQWANELSDKVSENDKLSVLVYHGGARTKDPSELAKYDVVVTTYTIVANEVPKQNADDDPDQKNGEGSSAGNKKKPPSKSKKRKKKLKDSDIDIDSGPVARVRWFRVVLDEAQTIKNFRTQVAKGCCGLRAKRRWCLSGTPIQNAIDELYSYFRFLKYDPYSTYSSFCTMIKHPIARNAVHGYKKLQTVLRIILLRRTKETMINGEPIINLPPKIINLEKVDFTKEERAFYMTLEERSRQQFKEYAAAGTLKQNYANILLLLLRLRQACDHPLLVKGHQLVFKGDGSIEMAKQLSKEKVIDLLARLEVSSLCAVCRDTPEDAVVTMCGHIFCYQCIYERITTDENTCPSPNCRNTLSTESVFSSGTLKICISGKTGYATASSSADNELSSISQSSYISSKIRATVDILNSIINTHALTESDTTESNPSRVAPVKAIVFTQWTGMLDLLELSLNINLIQYRRLDGTMSLNLRDKAVKDFNTDPEVRVMIMSLKAGNLGLNMVAACHVILLDLWWNPYAEDQAIDRAHRIGQTRAVTVSRLTIKDSVEDRILALQEEKRAMVNSAFGDDKSGGHASRLTVDDLRYLFRI